METEQSKRTLEEVLLILKEKSKRISLTIGEILETLSGKGYPLLLFILCLPFSLPIQIPGISTPFGLVVAFIGLRMTFGHHLLLPRFVLDKTVSHDSIEKIASAGLWVQSKIKRFTRKRLQILCGNPILHLFNGILIIFLGLLLALPIPLPLTNLLAAWPILLMSLGLMEDDGAFICASYVMAFICFTGYLILFLFLKSYSNNFF